MNLVPKELFTPLETVKFQVGLLYGMQFINVIWNRDENFEALIAKIAPKLTVG